jgi:Sulfotransferase family
LHRVSADNCHVDAIRRALAVPGQAAPERAFLGYALFKELDDLGDHASAWEALANASAEASLRAPYSRTAQEHLIASLKRLPVARRARAEDRIENLGSIVPIFVVGMHRSGTSLIERILGASTEVHDMGETDRLTAALRYGADLFSERVPDVSLLTHAERIDHRLVRKVFEDAAPMQSRGRRFVTEKLTSNFLNIGFIAQALPHAKILHMRREPIDLCFANYRELFAAPVTHVNRLDDLVHYHGLYEGLMRHWHASYPGLILDVDYEQLVRDPETESKRVFAFCGLQWQPEVVSIERRTSDPVSTLSSVQVRQPVNTASIGRWRPYAQWLGVLTDAFPVGPETHSNSN